MITIEDPDFPDSAKVVKAMESLRDQLPLLRKFIAKMYEKCEDADSSFADTRPVCEICYGSGWAPVYRQGQRVMVKCGRSYVDPIHGLKCPGALDSEEWWQKNHKDLRNKIWQLVFALGGTEEGMSQWLQKIFHVEWLEQLMIEQLEFVIIKLTQRLNAKERSCDVK